MSSKTLAERNNDPLPNWHEARWIGGTLYAGYRDDVNGGSPAPRPEFQHGKLPANPVLVAFRDREALNGTRDDAAEWVETAARVWAPEWEATLGQRAHARRVLHLLSVLA